METEEPKFEKDEDEDLAQVVSGHGPCTYLLLSLLLVILVFPAFWSRLTQHEQKLSGRARHEHDATEDVIRAIGLDYSFFRCQ